MTHLDETEWALIVPHDSPDQRTSRSGRARRRYTGLPRFITGRISPVSASGATQRYRVGLSRKISVVPSGAVRRKTRCRSSCSKRYEGPADHPPRSAQPHHSFIGCRSTAPGGRTCNTSLKDVPTNGRSWTDLRWE